MDSVIKCPEPGSEAVSNVQECTFVIGDQCRRYVCKNRNQK